MDNPYGRPIVSDTVRSAAEAEAQKLCDAFNALHAGKAVMTWYYGWRGVIQFKTELVR